MNFLLKALCFLILFFISHISIANDGNPLIHYSESNMSFNHDNKNDLFKYLNETLVITGMPENSRLFLLKRAEKRIAETNENDLTNKKILLQNNLRKLFTSLSKESTPIKFSYNKRSVVYKKTNMEAISWEEYLEYLQTNQNFVKLNIKNIEGAFNGLCPLWPFC